MNHRAMILLPSLAVIACGDGFGDGLTEFEREFTAQVTGTWSYSASVPATHHTSNLQCEIAGVSITVGNPTEKMGAVNVGIFQFDAQASGGTLGCTGDGIEDFQQDLATTPVETVLAPFGGLEFDFTHSTPLGEMRFENRAPTLPQSHSPPVGISANSWSGHVSLSIPSGTRSVGHFTTVRR